MSWLEVSGCRDECCLLSMSSIAFYLPAPARHFVTLARSLRHFIHVTRPPLTEATTSKTAKRLLKQGSPSTWRHRYARVCRQNMFAGAKCVAKRGETRGTYWREHIRREKAVPDMVCRQVWRFSTPMDAVRRYDDDISGLHGPLIVHEILSAQTGLPQRRF